MNILKIFDKLKYSLEDKPEPPPPPFEGIRFIDIGGIRYDYAPLEDITAHEAALLIPLFAAPFMRSDRFSYIRKHGLTRHFKEATDE